MLVIWRIFRLMRHEGVIHFIIHNRKKVSVSYIYKVVEYPCKVNAKKS